MEIVRLPAERPSVARYVEELWLPYNRELSRTVERFELASDVDLIGEEVEFRLGLLEEDTYRLWVCLSDSIDEPVDIASIETDLLGFVTADIDRAPSVFEQPDRMVLGDIYVVPDHRGEGVADALVREVKRYAQATDCTEVYLEVDIDNDRARGYYEKIGFEPYRTIMTAATDELPG